MKGNWLIQVGYLGSKRRHLRDDENNYHLNATLSPERLVLVAQAANPFYGNHREHSSTGIVANRRSNRTMQMRIKLIF